MELTAEQREIIEAAQGRPVDVIDPQSKQTYVLVSSEVYQRVRNLVEDVKSSPAVEPIHEAGEGQPKRVKLRELAMPPEVAAEAKQYCKKLGLWRSRYVQGIEEEFKLQYYYGGQPVYVVATPEGRVVIPIEERYRNTAGLRYILLTPEERTRAVYEVPSPWRDTVTSSRGVVQLLADASAPLDERAEPLPLLFVLPSKK